MRALVTAAILAIVLCVLPAPSFAILKKGEPAPAFKVTSTSGQQITQANYKGYVLLMDYFATWCHPCKEAIPHLNELNRKYGKKGLQIIGMSVEDDNDALKEFSTSKKITYPVAYANDDIQADYGIRSIPTLYIINKKGVVADKFMGYSDTTAGAIEALIIKLLAE